MKKKVAATRIATDHTLNHAINEAVRRGVPIQTLEFLASFINRCHLSDA